ncbi:hypothetical protein GGF50DRAFT_101547, partial [Schizophyllum commune]
STRHFGRRRSASAPRASSRPPGQGQSSTNAGSKASAGLEHSGHKLIEWSGVRARMEFLQSCVYGATSEREWSGSTGSLSGRCCVLAAAAMPSSILPEQFDPFAVHHFTRFASPPPRSRNAQNSRDRPPAHAVAQEAPSRTQAGRGQTGSSTPSASTANNA